MSRRFLATARDAQAACRVGRTPVFDNHQVIAVKDRRCALGA
jgi:hypothetical protein